MWTYTHYEFAHTYTHDMYEQMQVYTQTEGGTNGYIQHTHKQTHTRDTQAYTHAYAEHNASYTHA